MRGRYTAREKGRSVGQPSSFALLATFGEITNNEDCPDPPSKPKFGSRSARSDAICWPRITFVGTHHIHADMLRPSSSHLVSAFYASSHTSTVESRLNNCASILGTYSILSSTLKSPNVPFR